MAEGAWKRLFYGWEVVIGLMPLSCKNSCCQWWILMHIPITLNEATICVPSGHYYRGNIGGKYKSDVH